MAAKSNVGGKMTAQSYAHDRNSVQAFVYEEIEAIGADVEAFSPDATLEKLGLDSLDVVELSQSVTKKLGITVGPADFADAETISDVLAVIHKRAGMA
jgi:acyl carrier protein